MQPMPERPPGKTKGRLLDPPRFSGDFVWKFIGAFFSSVILWTGRVGEWFKYGGALVTLLFFTPVLSGDYRQVWAVAPGVALVYLILLLVILGQSAARKMSEPDSFFYSPLGEYIFNRKQFDERRRWEKEREKGRSRVRQESDLVGTEARLKEVAGAEELEAKLEQAEGEQEEAIRLAAQLRGEVRLYEVLLQSPKPVDTELLMERLLKEMDLTCVAVACYRQEGAELSLSGAAGGRFVPAVSLDADPDCPEVESWSSGADMVSQNASYPYEYMVSAVLPEELFVLIFRLNTTDLDQATGELYDIMMENKHLLLVASRILNARRPEFTGTGGRQKGGVAFD